MSTSLVCRVCRTRHRMVERLVGIRRSCKFPNSMTSDDVGDRGSLVKCSVHSAAHSKGQCHVERWAVWAECVGLVRAQTERVAERHGASWLLLVLDDSWESSRWGKTSSSVRGKKWTRWPERRAESKYICRRLKIMPQLQAWEATQSAALCSTSASKA